MKLRWRRSIEPKERSEQTAAAAKEIRALRRQSEQLRRTTEHSEYGQPGDDTRYPPA